MRLSLALLALAAAPPVAARAAPPALVAVAEALAGEVGAPLEGRRALLLEVETRAAALEAPLETALAAALGARGYAVTPHRGGAEAEGAARAASQDWLLRVSAGLVPGRREVALVGEIIPAWASFFLQRRPGARAIPPRVVQARAAADAETLLLAREARPAGAPFAALRTLARLPGRVLAVAVGEPGEPGEPAVVALTAASALVLSPSGRVLASRELGAPATPVRGEGAVLAVGDFGGGRIAFQRAGDARAEVLALRGERLEPAGALEGTPLCAGGAGRLFGAFAPGTGVLQDLLSPSPGPPATPRSERTLYGVAAAPGGGTIAFAALGTDLSVELLGPTLEPVAAGPAPLVTGSGFALADLDGDGGAELVASSAEPAGPERIRVLAPRSRTPEVYASGELAAAVLAAAGGDLSGDGVDDAVLAAIGEGPGGEVYSDLLLLTGDAREVP